MRRMKSEPRHAVIYSSDDSIYVADACKPFVAAVSAGKVVGEAWARGQYPGQRLSPKQLPGISSIGFWDASTNQDWGIKPHYNEGIELSMVLKGKVSFETEGKREIMSRGSLALTSPWQRHSHGDPVIQASRLVWIILDVGIRRPNSEWVWPSWVLATTGEKEKLARNIIHNRKAVCSSDQQMIRGFEDLYAVLATSSPGDCASEASVILNVILLALSKMVDASAETGPRLTVTQATVRHFLDKLKDHLDHPWRLEDMADQCGISKSQFSAVCHGLTNRSPIDYLNGLRLESAATELIREPDRSITDVCFQTGFNSSQYFSRRFSEFFGVPPRQYRKMHEQSVFESS
ncbi:MAG: AraC family transcriptional regulator [Hyphomicrobiales bacterium]|nr:AraC family transcriptional regulator [Hyphomicrobiales bacterium]